MSAEIQAPPLLLLIGIMSSGQLAMAIYLPSIPFMADALGTTVGLVQMTLTVYLVSFALSQLFIGPLSDRYGRRPVLVGGLLVFFLASILCALAPDIETLLAARVLQATGACAGIVLSRAIVRDTRTPEQTVRAMAYVTIAMAISPSLGPLVGGQLQVLFGWRANFVAMAVAAGTVLGLAALMLPETARAGRGETPPPGGGLRAAARAYRSLLANHIFLGYALNAAFATAAFTAFLAAGPILLMKTLGIGPQAFGLYNIYWTGSFMLGSSISSMISPRLGPMRMAVAGSAMAFIAAAIMVILALLGEVTIAAVIVPMLFIGLGNGFSVPNSFGAALAAAPAAIAGTAAAVMGFLQMALAAAATFAMSLAVHADQLPLGLAIASLSLAGLAALVLVAHRKRT